MKTSEKRLKYIPYILLNQRTPFFLRASSKELVALKNEGLLTANEVANMAVKLKGISRLPPDQQLRRSDKRTRRKSQAILDGLIGVLGAKPLSTAPTLLCT